MMEDLDVATAVVWVLRIALPLVLVCLCFGVPKSLQSLQWLLEVPIRPSRHVYPRANLLRLRKLCKELEPPDALACLKTVDETTAPSLFQDRKKRDQDREEREQRHKDRKKNKEDQAQQKEVAKAQEEQMHLESLVNYVAFNRKEQQRTFHHEASFVPPPPPGRPPANPSQSLQVGSAVQSATGDRANKEVQMVLRGAMKLGRVEMAKDLYEKLLSLKVEVAPATFALMVEACIQAEDLQSASDFLMKMEAAGHALDNNLLDKVMDLYTVHKKKRELRKVIETVSETTEKETDAKEVATDNQEGVVQPALQQALNHMQHLSDLKPMDRNLLEETQMPFATVDVLLTPEEAERQRQLSAAAAALVEEPASIPVRRLVKQDIGEELLAPLQLPGQPWPGLDTSSAVTSPPRLSANAVEFLPSGPEAHAAMPGFLGDNTVWDASGAVAVTAGLPPGTWAAGQVPPPLTQGALTAGKGKEEKAQARREAFFVPEEFRDPDMVEPVAGEDGDITLRASGGGGMSADAAAFVPGAALEETRMSADAPAFMPTTDTMVVSTGAPVSPPKLNAGAMSFVPQEFVTYDASECTWTIEGQMMLGGYQEMHVPMPPPPPPPGAPPPRQNQNKSNQNAKASRQQPKGAAKQTGRIPKSKAVNGAPQVPAKANSGSKKAPAHPLPQTDRPPPPPKGERPSPAIQPEKSDPAEPQSRYRPVQSELAAAMKNGSMDGILPSGEGDSRKLNKPPKSAGTKMGRNGPRTQGVPEIQSGAAAVVVNAALAAAKDIAASVPPSETTSADPAETQHGAGTSSKQGSGKSREWVKSKASATPKWTKKVPD